MMRPFVAMLVETPANCSGRQDVCMANASRYSFNHSRRICFHRGINRSIYIRKINCASSPSSNGASIDNGAHANVHENNRTGDDIVWTKYVAETILPTMQGKFRLRGYRHTKDGGVTFTEPAAIISGNVEGQRDVVVRVHDACFTSEVLGSLKCDCREQLQLALAYIHDQPPGMVIYLHQEGRGIGLANKIAAYSLQERKGLDTVDANRALGLPDDCREYSAVKHILDELGIQSIRLMTNNPRKLSEMKALNIPVTDRIPCLVKSTQYNEGYLSAKQVRMDHILHEYVEEEEPLEGQFCFWNHEGEPSSSGIPLDPETEQGIAVLAEMRRRDASGDGRDQSMA